MLQRLCRCADFFAKNFFSWIFWQGASNCSPGRRGFLFAALSFQRITRIFTYLILKDKLSVEIREIRGGWPSPPNLPLLRGGTWIAWQANCAPSWKGGGRGGWRELGVSQSPPNLPLLRGGTPMCSLLYTLLRSEQSCNYSTIIFIKVNKNTIISLKMYLFANMTVFLLKNILFSQ